jgi:5'-deoxynucleotidase YfbR-like HD superfamily hydrolase
MKSNYITTYTGLHVVPMDLQPDDIEIRDIAHALSLTTRGNGHVKTFFSVARHCIHCALEAKARGYTEDVVLACLLHDASEAYLSDIPSPIKPYLPEFNRYEDQIMDAVYTKYLGAPLTDDQYHKVKAVDRDMLYYDLLVLLNERSDRPEPVMLSTFNYDERSFEDVERQYLQLFESLSHSVLSCEKKEYNHRG